MISNIRGAIHKAGYRYVVWGLLIIFAFSGIGASLIFRRQQANAVAEVNGYAITHQEFRTKVHLFDQRIKDLRQQFGDYANYFLQSLGLSDDPVAMAYDELVREKLLLSAADRLSLAVLSPEYVAEKLSQPAFVMQHLGMLVPPYLYDAEGDLNKLALDNHLKRMGLSYSQFDEAVESALKQYFIVSLTPSAVYVSPQDLEYAWKQDHARRVFKVVELDVDDYVAELQEKEKDEKALQEYFAAHNNLNKRYWSQERRSGTVWKFPAESYGITISEPELKTAYERNKNRWPGKTFDAVRKDIEKMMLKDKFNTRFTADARRAIAQGDAQAIQQFAQKYGGKKSTITKEVFAPDSLVLNKLFSIKTKGKAATAVSDLEGYVIVLDELQERALKPFGEVRADVERDYYQEKATHALAAEIQALLKDISPAAFKAFIDKKSLKERTVTISGDSKKAWEGAEKEGLPVARMKRMIHPGYALAYPTKGGVALALLDSFEPENAKMNDAERTALEKRLRTQEMQLVPASFIASLWNSATIKEYKDITGQQGNQNHR